MEGHQEGLGEFSSRIRFEVDDGYKINSGMLSGVGIRCTGQLF